MASALQTSEEFLDEVAGRGGDDGCYLSLGELLTNMLQHYSDTSKAVYARDASPAGDRDRAAHDRALLEPLQDGMSLESRPVRYPNTPADDLSRLVLTQDDIPDTTAGSLVFRFAGGVAAAMEETRAGVVGDVSERRRLPVVDRHRGYCRPVCELSTEFRDFSGASFPMFVRDTKFVFETHEAAHEYFRRGWRFLSENGVVVPTTPTASSHIYGMATAPQREIKEAPIVGDESHVYHTVDVAGSTLTDQGFDDKPSDVVFVVFRVGCVITKLVVASRSGQVPLEQVLAIVGRAEANTRSWTQACDVAQVVRKLPSPLATHRTQLIGALRRVGDERAAQQSVPEVLAPEPCAHCGVTSGTTKRCGGCRLFSYCDRTCQAAAWSQGHNRRCSKEFMKIDKRKASSPSRPAR
eukprot:m.312822 g.312822  ORF g.312822 m.312822 type:complete len:409 (+) comp19661_c2_seq5:3307-4533(+)